MLGSIPGGTTEQVQMYLNKEPFNGPKDWGVPGRLLRKKLNGVVAAPLQRLQIRIALYIV